ncbi:S8 family peptidase [Haloferula sargassicola]|uniref:Peptidase S8/S53 domain-containing protein n=1 Tax=Haloferula sargassicola TaxID=490096 RepID=A0ABP9UXV3_9BACT
MPESIDFPHLHWSYEGPYEASFNGGRGQDQESAAAKADRPGHVGRLRGQLSTLRTAARATDEARRAVGLPELRGKGFILRVPEGTDVDALAHALGIELVAETESGLMFAASDTLDLDRFEEVLARFAIDARGGGGAASVLEVFEDGADDRKLAELLVGSVLQAWPFDDATIYTFDVGVQTSASTREWEWTRRPRRHRDQSVEEHARQVAEVRLADHIRAEEQWMEAADERYRELEAIVRHYNGEVMDGMTHAEARETRHGIVFPDSIEVRIRMSGSGFRDLVENSPHLFEVSLPPDVSFLPGSPELAAVDLEFELLAPSETAPKVCVIDSGIEEGHRWLAPAIDTATSRCFIPEDQDDDVADFVNPRGHGTRVAGAVLYPREIPKSGAYQPVAWIQNARVLDSSCKIPISLPPESYLTQVVAHYHSGEKPTRIFNHSIAAESPCASKRMCSWAAKIDDLAHRHDLLFVQAPGNVEPPAIYGVLHAGGAHPDQLLDDSSKVASPGQSLHALTVGSVAHAVFNDGTRQSFAQHVGHPSAFSRGGHSPLWNVVKPEVVEFGGDRIHEIPLTRIMPTRTETSPELVASTMHGQPAISLDDVGTSFSTPKVAHIAAQIQAIFPTASSQLYRALIVQSARWPEWAEFEPDRDKVLRLIGYGLPSIERATSNTPNRVTLITEQAEEIWSKHYHLYRIRVPESIRGAALEGRIRVDVTLAYTASPRRTRSRRTGYLETWLDWRASGRDEPADRFAERMEGKRKNEFPGFPWKIHQNTQHGEVETSRDKGSVQKDWMVLQANELPEAFCIAVRAHVGWNHKEGGGLARYCLVVSFESLDIDLPVYAAVQAEIRGRIEAETATEVEIF